MVHWELFSEGADTLLLEDIVNNSLVKESLVKTSLELSDPSLNVDVSLYCCSTNLTSSCSDFFVVVRRAGESVSDWISLLEES